MRLDQLINVYSMHQSIEDLLDDVVSVLYIQSNSINRRFGYLKRICDSVDWPMCVSMQSGD